MLQVNDLDLIKHAREIKQEENNCQCSNKKIDNPWELKVRRVSNGYIVSYLVETDEEDRYIEKVYACEDGADKDFYISWNDLDVDINEIDDEEVALANVFNVMREYFSVYYNKHKRVNLSIGFEDSGEDLD